MNSPALPRFGLILCAGAIEAISVACQTSGLKSSDRPVRLLVFALVLIKAARGDYPALEDHTPEQIIPCLLKAEAEARQEVGEK